MYMYECLFIYTHVYSNIRIYTHTCKCKISAKMIYIDFDHVLESRLSWTYLCSSSVLTDTYTSIHKHIHIHICI